MTNKKHLCMQFYQPSPFKYPFWFYKWIIHSPCLPRWEKESCNLINYFVSRKNLWSNKRSIIIQYIFILFNTCLITYYALCKRLCCPFNIQDTKGYHTVFLVLSFGSLQKKTLLPFYAVWEHHNFDNNSLTLSLYHS